MPTSAIKGRTSQRLSNRVRLSNSSSDPFAYALDVGGGREEGREGNSSGVYLRRNKYRLHLGLRKMVAGLSCAWSTQALCLLTLAQQTCANFTPLPGSTADTVVFQSRTGLCDIGTDGALSCGPSVHAGSEFTNVGFDTPSALYRLANDSCVYSTRLYLATCSRTREARRSRLTLNRLVKRRRPRTWALSTPNRSSSYTYLHSVASHRPSLCNSNSNLTSRACTARYLFA